MKKVLFPILALVLALGLALPMAVAPVVGSPAYIETIYLSDSGPIADPPWTTYIYEVKLIDGATPAENRAELWPLPAAGNLPGYDPGEIPFNTVDALACTPDGKKLYCIEKISQQLGYWDLETNNWYTVGTSTGIPECVLAAFDSGGTLYAASDNMDSLYTVNLTTGVGSLVGQIMNDMGTPADPSDDVIVNVSGADLVWGSGPTLYLWANADGAPKGLYTLTVPGSPGPVTASYIGGSAYPSFYTGLAIRGGGAGDLVGSNTTDDAIVQIDKTTGMPVADIYPMYDEDTATLHDYGYGDMTVGELEVEIQPSIDIVKSANVTEVHHDDTITYTYLVENTGNVDLGPPTVVDNILPVTPTAVKDGHPYNIGDTDDDNVFSPGEIWEFTASYPVPPHTWGEDDPIVDTATATALYRLSEITAGSNQVSVDILHTSSPPPAVGGEVYPVNKVSVLALWLGLALVLIGGISCLVLRRRRA